MSEVVEFPKWPMAQTKLSKRGRVHCGNCGADVFHMDWADKQYHNVVFYCGQCGEDIDV